MTREGEPQICPYDGSISSVQVSYILDFKRLGLVDGYTKEVMMLFARHALDIGLECGVKVLFNGQTLESN